MLVERREDCRRSHVKKKKRGMIVLNLTFWLLYALLIELKHLRQCELLGVNLGITVFRLALKVHSTLTNHYFEPLKEKDAKGTIHAVSVYILGRYQRYII